MELMRCAVGWCGSHPVILNGEGTAIDPTGFPDLSLYLDSSNGYPMVTKNDVLLI